MIENTPRMPMVAGDKTQPGIFSGVSGSTSNVQESRGFDTRSGVRSQAKAR